jgi:hypothetical protein
MSGDLVIRPASPARPADLELPLVGARRTQ